MPRITPIPLSDAGERPASESCRSGLRGQDTAHRGEPVHSALPASASSHAPTLPRSHAPAPPTQRHLPITDPKFRPTLGMDGAKHLLDLNEDYILDLLADRSIAWSWHIGLGSERREIRILRAALDHYVAHGSKTPFPLADDQVLDLLIAPQAKDRSWLTNGEIQRALNCVSDHVLHLVESQDLALQPKTDYGRGPNGSALVTIASFKRFLQTRRLPC